MPTPRRTSEVRQVELTDAALHIIATKGIAALSTRSLAQQVGLSSGAIFRHYASLDGLLDAVVSRVETVLNASLPAATLPPVERLERFVAARSTAVGTQLGILRLVVSEQFLLALPKGGSERLSACVQHTRAFLTRCLRDGQSTGAFRTDIAAEILTPIVMGTVQMLALSSAKQERSGATILGGLLTLLGAQSTPSPKSKRTKS